MMQPMYAVEFSWLGVGIIAVGVIGIVLGLLIVHRITRDPEDGPDHWRSHRH
jgi:hypothetical protein